GQLRLLCGKARKLATASGRMIVDRRNRTIGGIDADRIAGLRAREAAAYEKARPISKQAMGNGAAGYLGGVPMHWMRDWPMPFPFVVDKAKGATITDVDGNELADFCFGDTGSMFGHSPKPVARAI